MRVRLEKKNTVEALDWGKMRLHRWAVTRIVEPARKLREVPEK